MRQKMYRQAEYDSKFQYVYQDEVRGIIDKQEAFLLFVNTHEARVCRNREQVDDCISRTECRRWYVVPKKLFSK